MTLAVALCVVKHLGRNSFEGKKLIVQGEEINLSRGRKCFTEGTISLLAGHKSKVRGRRGMPIVRKVVCCYCGVCLLSRKRCVRTGSR
mgnify:FL=1